jgi:hypothetical protein
MIRAARWLWKTGILSTFLAGLFAVLPIVIIVGIMAWVGGLPKAWLGPESFVGKALFQMPDENLLLDRRHVLEGDPRPIHCSAGRVGTYQGPSE